MFSHAPVMINESIDSLVLNKSGAYLDCTFGLGGHSKEILKRLNSKGTLNSIDQDQTVIEYAKKIQDPRFKFEYSKFSKIGELFINRKFDGILFDLGVSSVHLDSAERGFSFNKNATLDMRFDRTEGKKVSHYVNELPEREIEHILRSYGQEKFSKRIAKNIEKHRINNPINNTLELVSIINKSVIVNDKNKHNATRSFQALRIFVNKELEVLKDVLEKSYNILAPKGRLVLITYHSLEENVINDFIAVSYTHLTLPTNREV